MFDYYYLFKGIRLPLWLCAIVWALPNYAQCDFREVATEQQITHSFGIGLLGSGVSFMDFDGDGWDDLTFGTSEGETVEVYRNNQGSFEKITLAGVTNTCESKQITWVDFDNDGDKDLYYSCVGDNLVLYRNNGDLTFTDVTEEVGLVSPIGSALGSNWADFDRDGWLDLYATYYGGSRNVLYRNIGGTSFQNVTLASNVATTQKPTFCGVVFDYDNDGWEDIYLANDRSTRNDLIKNLGDLSFEDVSAASRSDLPMDAMGTTLLDMNHDGYFEVYISNSPKGNALIYNNGDGTFTDIAEESGTLFSSVGWGVNTLDFDNDGFWDIYVSGSEIGTDVLSSALYRATSTTSFELTQFEGMVTDTMASFSNAVGDFNRDGRMDIVVSNSNQTPSQLWQNSCTNEYHWLKVKLQGRISNRDGIGSRVIVYTETGPLYQYMTAGTSFMAQNTDYLHFGLAQNTKVDSMFIEWPSGLRDRLNNPGIDQMLTVIEGSSTSPVPLQGSEQVASLCEGESITLSVDVYGEDLSVFWSNEEEGKSIEISENGSYSAVVQKGELSMNSEAIDIDFSPLPDVTVTSTPVTNTGPGSITITENNGNFTYRWAHDPEETGKTLTGLEAGIYQVQISNSAGCLIELTITVETDVVTSLDDPLLSEIDFRFESGRLVVHLPVDLTLKLQESVLLNDSGQLLQTASVDSGNSEIRFAPFANEQLVILHLHFTDGRVIKKLMVRD